MSKFGTRTPYGTHECSGCKRFVTTEATGDHICFREEKEAAKQDFIARFRWNNEDQVLLHARDESEAAPCIMCKEQSGTERVHDYEDDVSGGAPMCWPCAADLVRDCPPREAWVTQDPEGAWNGIGSAAGSGWSGLWFLFAPVGRYASPMSEHPGEWPTEERAS